MKPRSPSVLVPVTRFLRLAIRCSPLRGLRLFLLCPLAFSAPAATLWNGPSLAYTQPAHDPTQPANQDHVTAGVWLTRAASGGLFNAVTETAADTNSPADTEWAFGTLDRFASLTYTNWLAWLNGQSPVTLVGQPVVVHGDGTSLWTVTHADDFAKGLVGLLGNAEAAFLRFHVGEGGDAAQRAARQECGAEGVGVAADGLWRAEDFCGDAVVVKLDLRIPVEAPRMVGFNEMDRVTLGQRVSMAGLPTGNDELHLHEFAPVGACLAGDGADGEILVARGGQQVAQALGDLNAVQRGKGDGSVVRNHGRILMGGTKNITRRHEEKDR